jgi:hypothetical protein
VAKGQKKSNREKKKPKKPAGAVKAPASFQPRPQGGR